MSVDLSHRRVFLSGPMTGRAAYNAQAFALAHARCKLAGAAKVYDPAVAWLQEPQSKSARKSHEDYMRECLRELASFPYDMLVQLDGWEASEGATLEARAASALGMDVVPLADVAVPSELEFLLADAPDAAAV